MRLPHELFRSGSVPDPNGLALLGGGADVGGAVREGVSEEGGMVVLGASGPWGRPRGLTVILVVRRISDSCTRPVTIEICHSSSSSCPSSSPSWPCDEDLTASATGLGHGPNHG
jgi:hypothetical protein